ncbi:MAG: hypothetical protein ABI639_13245 [Thermoanaerobaculia bacterium]
MSRDPEGRRSGRRIVLTLLGLAVLPGFSLLHATPVKIHQLSGATALAAGTLEGVRVDSRGVLTIAADVDRIADLEEPFAFSLATLPDGWAIGTGNAGKVLKVARDGKVSLLFDAPESNVFALLADADGTLFVGTSPEGKVYRIRSGSAPAAAETFFDPKETYIWALARGADGALWVATGTAGHLYRVDSKGKGTLAFDADETHLRSLLVASNGDLLIGTAGQGLVLRLPAATLATARAAIPELPAASPTAPTSATSPTSPTSDTAGKVVKSESAAKEVADASPARTIYDSALGEVVAMAEAPGGTIFAAVLSSESSLLDLSPPRPPADSAAAEGADPQGTVTVAGESDGDAAAGGSRPPGAKGPRSELVAISREGLVEPVWSSADETVFALASAGSRLYLGTGGEGRLYSVQGARTAEVTEVAETAEAGALSDVPPVAPFTVAIEHDFDSRQVVGLAGGGAGGGNRAGKAPAPSLPVALTTNAAGLFRLSQRAATKGSYTSVPLDAGLLARYGMFRWTGEQPAGTHLRVRFRTGTSAVPDATWSPWSAALEGTAVDSISGAGRRVESPGAGSWEIPLPPIGTGRFLQWQVEMTGEGGRSPRLLVAETSYTQVNQRPKIERFGALDPGQILVPANFNPADQVYEPASPNKDGIFTTLQPSTGAGDGRTKQLWKRGQRTLRWRASDPNGDPLRFRVEVGPESSAAGWLQIVDDLDDDHYGFDATVLPDGRYRFRLTVSDRLGNAGAGENQPLTAELESESVVIDHTPPTRGVVERGDGGLKLRVADAWNPLRDAMLSIDAAEWLPVRTSDGLLDGQVETLILGEIPAAAKLVLLRLGDAALNYDTFDLTSEVRR